MKVILTHESADFDAFAASVAARLLYPGAEIVLGLAVGAPVRDFLALHRDRFPVLRPHDVDFDAVTCAVIVDVRRASRLSAFEGLLSRIRRRDASLTVHVFDHHPSAEDDIEGEVHRVEPVGAVTTLLVEEIRRRGLEVDPVEATLFALGIYADTGCFCYPTTTARDVAAGAWLLQQGTSLGVLSRFLNPPLSEDHKRLLLAVLQGVETERIRGMDVGFAELDEVRHIEGLDLVTTKALEIERVDALFLLQDEAGKKIQIVARSRSRGVDVADVLTSLGGGGYASAAAARVKGKSVGAIRAEIRARLLAHSVRPERVVDVMTERVRCLHPTLTLREAGQSLERWDVRGAPVVRDGTLVGVLSTRDVSRAGRAGRIDLPVASHMAQHVRTAAPEWTLEEALETMQREDVGRLPVVAGGRIVGILSRSDVLRRLYGEGSRPL